MALDPNNGRGPTFIAPEHEARSDRRHDLQAAVASRRPPEQNGGAARAIFLHSSWRASHTWFWLKFREQPSTLSFYEPFHEVLATLTRSGALLLGPKSWNSRHPASAPYMLEFIPLIRKSGGVRLFVPQISYEWFVPPGGPSGHLHSSEIKYLALLARHAERQKRIPVFGFARSLGRLPAIKKSFPGLHIFHYRNLWTQWMSWVDQKRNNNSYFFSQMLRILLEAKDPYLSIIMKRHTRACFHYQSGDGISDSVCKDPSSALLASMDEQQLFTLYMAFHIYVYLIAQSSADCVIDTSRLARDRAYRDRTYDQFAAATGLTLTFDDVFEIQQYHPFNATTIDWQQIKDDLDLAVMMLEHLFDRQKLFRYGTELVNDTFSESESSERYIASARNEIARLTAERDSAVAANSRLAADRDRLASERDHLLAEVNRLSALHGE